MTSTTTFCKETDNSYFVERYVWQVCACQLQVFGDFSGGDYAPDTLAGFGVMLFDPGHVAKKLPNNAVVAAGHLKFDNHETPLGIQGECVNKPAPNGKLNAGNAFVLIELKAGLDER
jgi:hypothetical protein